MGPTDLAPYTWFRRDSRSWFGPPPAPCSFAGSAESPAGVDLEDDPALQRLIAFVDSDQCVRVLAEIEDQLNQEDPEFSDLFRNHPLPRIVGRWHVFSLARLGLLVAVLLALVLAHPLAALWGASGVALLAAALVVPWVVTAARANGCQP